MAYIGRSVDVGMFEKQVITADSSTTTFTLSFAVGSANSLLVVYGGVIQEPAVAYSVSGGGQSIVFSEAPVTGTTTYIIYLGKQLTTPRAAGQETTKQTFTGNGSTVTYTLTDPPVVPAGIMVFVDGILQREGSGNNYVSSGSTITFSTAPDTSAEIDVYTLVKEKVSIDTVADGSITFAKLVAGSPTWNGAGETVIATASTGNSLRITNTGSGNSLLVEDSASTDSTPFVISAAGAVGVGTASPSLQLHVSGSSTYVAGIEGSSTFALMGFKASGTTGTMADPNVAIGATGDALYLRSGGAERARIDSSGNVGIGASSPASRLDIFTSIAGGLVYPITLSANNSASAKTNYTQIGFGIAQGAAGSETGGFELKSLRNNTFVNLAQYDGAAGSAAWKFYTEGSERMRILSGGNVGIGISAPTSKLHVSGGRTDLTANNETYALGVRYGTGTGIYYIGATNSATPDLVFSQTGGSERMRITNDGNVGIGTNAPANKLTAAVVGNATLNTPAAHIAIFNSNDAINNQYYGLAFTNSNTPEGATQKPQALISCYAAGGSWSSNWAADLLFSTASGAANAVPTEKMRIDAGGNLLVGRTSTFNSAKIALTCLAGTQSVAFGIASNVTRATGTQYGYTLYRDNTTETNAVTFVENGGSGNNACSYVVRTNAATGGTAVTNVSGGVALVNGGTSWSSYSDLRLKHDVVPITNALDSILKIDPIFFKWNDRPIEQQRSIGVSAQSVEKVFPELIDRSSIYDVEGGAMQVRYTELIPILLASIQELKAIVDAQAVEIAALKAK